MGFQLGISATIINQKAYTQDLSSIPDEIIQGTADLIVEAALEIDARAKVAVPVDTGRLRSSIRPVFRNGLAGEVGTNVKYAKFIEYGTGPLGAMTNEQALPPGYVHGPTFTPPSEKLKGWSKRHGGNDAGAYNIAKAIKMKGGAKARPFLGPAAKIVLLKLTESIQSLFGRIIQRNSGRKK